MGKHKHKRHEKDEEVGSRSSRRDDGHSSKHHNSSHKHKKHKRKHSHRESSNQKDVRDASDHSRQRSHDRRSCDKQQDRHRSRSHDHDTKEHRHRSTSHDHDGKEHRHRSASHDHDRKEHRHRSMSHDRDRKEHRQRSRSHDRDRKEHRQRSTSHDRDSKEHRQRSTSHDRDRKEHRQRSTSHDRDRKEYRQRTRSHDRDMKEHRHRSTSHDRDRTEHRHRSTSHDHNGKEHRQRSRSHDHERKEHRHRSTSHDHDGKEHRHRSTSHDHDGKEHRHRSTSHDHDGKEHRHRSTSHDHDGIENSKGRSWSHGREPNRHRTHDKEPQYHHRCRYDDEEKKSYHKSHDREQYRRHERFSSSEKKRNRCSPSHDRDQESQSHHRNKKRHSSSSHEEQSSQNVKECDQASEPALTYSVDVKDIEPHSGSHVDHDQNLDAKDSSADDDHEFDFQAHRSELNKIFFREEDLIVRGSQEYRDFWTFLEKYQAFKRSKLSKARQDPKEGNRKTAGKLLDLPKQYDKRYRINVSIKTRDIKSWYHEGRDREDRAELTRKRLSQFRAILLHYVDFGQKQKFAKLAKIKKDQSNLPMYLYKQTVIDTVKNYQVVVVAGDTGCGKSTQVPQYLLGAGFKKIACTQPRRIACISLCKRVGYETLNEFGKEVGYQVRFEKSKNLATKVLFLTEGLLLRQMSTDPLLSMYDVIVIDEVHERHIHTDFLLGILKYLIQHREDLKVVLMSATINIGLFSGYFDDCPVIKVPGRLYPIQLEYCPIKTDEQAGKTERMDPRPYLRIMQLIEHKYPTTERGDLLIFLSGMTEIMSVVEAARMFAQQTKRWIILPLHSSLSIDEQDKVFDIAPDGVRKCIVSTNIAETSVTIDGVRFIADSGKVKEMSFDPKSKMQRLQEFWISRASAEQRKGRAGRTGPGVCYRLYAEADYEAFQEYATPEIQRVPLDSIILQLIAMGLPDTRKFPFIEPPSTESVENSIIFLKEQGAVTDEERLTPIGEMLSQLPVDVIIGKMLIMGAIFHMIDPVLSIAAAMSVQSPFTHKAYQDHDAIAARKSLESEHGDPLTLLNVFDAWLEVKADGQGSKKWCRRRCLEEQRFYEVTKLKQQFKDLLKDHKLMNDDKNTPKFYTSEERKRRHGDRKRLWELKKEEDKNRKRRKVLKLDESEYTIERSDDEEGEGDVKDLEFRLTHDLDKIQDTSNTARNFTYRDITLLKIILCSGLFPQVAIADNCNSYRRDSDQAFHTKMKPFVLLHPNSIFAHNPDLLEIKLSDAESAMEKKEEFSHKHELLLYGSLLETTKPYLCNPMRVPALQTLLLYSQSLDTNSDLTRIICDGWLEIKFADLESAEQSISSIIHLRTTWHNLLTLRLKDTFEKMDKEAPVRPEARRLERILATKLTEFLDSKVKFSVRRVLAAEMKHMYRCSETAGRDLDSKTFGVLKDVMKSASGSPHPVKGGIKINHYLNYDCLLDAASASVWGEYTTSMQKHWTCPKCNETMVVTVVERLTHQSQCGGKDEENKLEVQEEEETKEAKLSRFRNPYACPICEKDFLFTSTEILKHKKTHA